MLSQPESVLSCCMENWIIMFSSTQLVQARILTKKQGGVSDLCDQYF